MIDAEKFPEKSELYYRFHLLESIRNKTCICYTIKREPGTTEIDISLGFAYPSGITLWTTGSCASEIQIKLACPFGSAVIPYKIWTITREKEGFRAHYSSDPRGSANTWDRRILKQGLTEGLVELSATERTATTVFSIDMKEDSTNFQLYHRKRVYKEIPTQTILTLDLAAPLQEWGFPPHLEFLGTFHELVNDEIRYTFPEYVFPVSLVQVMLVTDAEEQP